MILNNIKNIKKTDYVLEIGPGGTPHPRSDIFLEKYFSNAEEFTAQRGVTTELITDKPIIYFDGGIFPFKNNEFDYTICSHVLEHVDDVNLFLSEIVRVSKRGYIEYPTIYYDFLYNIPEHVNLLFKKNDIIFWLKKNETEINEFKQIQLFFKETLIKGYPITNKLEYFFFQGFEWCNNITTKKANSLKDVCFDISIILEMKNYDLTINAPFCIRLCNKIKHLKNIFRKKI